MVSGEGLLPASQYGEDTELKSAAYRIYHMARQEAWEWHIYGSVLLFFNNVFLLGIQQGPVSTLEIPSKDWTPMT
jgi:hypothetical protein